MSTVSPWMLVAVALTFMGVVAALMFRQGSLRRTALARVAGELGFAFFPEADFALASRLAKSPLFPTQREDGLGNPRTITYRPTNLLRGQTGNLIIEIFEFSCCVRTDRGKGPGSSTSWGSVVLFEFKGTPLPSFDVEPKIWLSGALGNGVDPRSCWVLGGCLNPHCITFDQRPSFSSAYALRGDDENSIRDLFNVDVLEYFESESRCITKGAGVHLILHPLERSIPPELIRSHVENGIRLLTLFRRLAPGDV